MESLKNAWALFRGANRIGLILLVAALAALSLLAGNLARDGGGAGLEIEARLAAVLSQVEGAGRVRVAVGEGEGGGVLVVAQGADNLKVALALSRAVRTVLGVENAEIEVLKMK